MNKWIAVVAVLAAVGVLATFGHDAQAGGERQIVVPARGGGGTYRKPTPFAQ